MKHKIIFKLECDDEGYPPIEYELLNATNISEDNFRIDNAPFFVSNVSYHDIVQACESEVPGQYYFVKLIQESTFTSISVIIIDREMDVFLMDLFRGLNCVIEYGEFGSLQILGVAVPASTDYQKLRVQLEFLELQSKLSFSELVVAHE